MVASPCINICRMVQGVCVGCQRTLDEIARWGNAGDAEKRAILAAVAERRGVAGARDALAKLSQPAKPAGKSDPAGAQ